MISRKTHKPHPHRHSARHCSRHLSHPSVHLFHRPFHLRVEVRRSPEVRARAGVRRTLHTLLRNRHTQPEEEHPRIHHTHQQEQGDRLG